MKQAIGIPVGIEPAPFLANLFLYYYEVEYMSSVISSDEIKARHFHSTKDFIDDLCAINDGGEFGRFIVKYIQRSLNLTLNIKDDHDTFLNLDITIEEGTFIYKLIDKRDSFPFSIVRMPHIEINIPQSIFYSAIKGQFLRTARSTICLRDFVPKAKKLLGRMKQQGSKPGTTGTSIRKIILAHLESFQHFSISCQGLLNIFVEDNLQEFSFLYICVYI